jgi:hypothetical protein
MYKPRLRSILWTVLAGALFALPAMADSQARIVRLSDVQGLVQIDKNSGLGFETAFLNLPIILGAELRTRDNGRAEVEFEDGSTLRLTPNTTVVFSALSLSDAGKRISAVNLVEGKAYLNWIGKSGDDLTLNFAREKVQLTQPAHFRVARSSSTVEIASFKNELEVTGPSAAIKVEKGKMVAFDLNDNDKATQAKSVAEDPYDQWDQQAIDYHDQYSKNNSTPYGYGYSDLSYYGNYTNVPGYGMMWQPYFTGVGWDPFMDGAWSWYPGMGFLWASAYPWGWLPYNYGNWAFAPGYGWGWQPGGWHTWHSGLHYVGADAATFHAPVAPTGTVNTVAVGRGGPVMMGAPSPRLTVYEGSAGLGIPRGSYGNLRHFNTQVAKTGSVELHSAPQFEASSWRTSGYGSGHPTAFGGGMHSGSASSGHASGGGGRGGR